MTLAAAIDVGTNSVRLLVAEKISGQIEVLHRELIATRIGEGIGNSKKLKQEAVERTADAIALLVNRAKNMTAQNIYIFATSAVRDASNQNDFVTAVRKRVNIVPEIITGEEEAELSFIGATSTMTTVPEELVVIDIGGGSTEIIFKKDKIDGVSVALGAVRLSESPMPKQEIINAFEQVTRRVPFEKPYLVAVGGTPTSLAAIIQGLVPYDSLRVHGYKLAAKDVTKTTEWLFGLDIETRKKVPGLQPQRADIIPYGAEILSILMELLDSREVMVSESDLLEGRILKGG